MHPFQAGCSSFTPLQLIASASEPLEIKQAASVNFKNYVKFHWVPRESHDLSGKVPAAVSDADKVGRGEGRCGCILTVGLMYEFIKVSGSADRVCAAR